MLRAGFEPATCRLGVDNGNVAGPQQRFCRGRGMRSGADLNRSGAAGGSTPLFQITEPLRPATKANPPGFEPGPARLELAVLPLHHRFVSGRPGSNGPLRAGEAIGRAAKPRDLRVGIASDAEGCSSG